MEVHFSITQLILIGTGSLYLLVYGLVKLIAWTWYKFGQHFGYSGDRDPLCSECHTYPADSPSSRCQGCDTYAEHTSVP